MAREGYQSDSRVFGLTHSYRGGTLAENVAIEARNLAPLPGAVDFTDRASAALPRRTAVQGLVEHGRLPHGRPAPVHGAPAAAGSLGTPLAPDRGAQCIDTARACSPPTAP